MKVENSFIDYFKSNTEISKGMTVIDNKLGGTTILDVTLDFDHKNVDINNSEINLEPIEDDFDDLLMEFEEDSNEPKYWFTEYKMGQIEKLGEAVNGQAMQLERRHRRQPKASVHLNICICI